jgi:hypothetical protein
VGSPSTPRSADCIALIALVAIGCSSSPAPPRSSLDARGGRVSQATELLWSIEGRASECSVARPTLLSDAQRSRLATFRARSRTGSLGYVLGQELELPRIASFASCTVTGHGQAARVMRLRFSRPIEAHERGAILDALPFEARWGDEPCEGRCWPPRVAELVAHDTLEIAMPVELGVIAPGDVRTTLARELTSRPNLLEASVVALAGTEATAIELIEVVPRGLELSRSLRGEPGSSLTWESLLAAFGDSRLPPEAASLRLRGAVPERLWAFPWPMVDAWITDEQLASERARRLSQRDRVVPLGQIDLDSRAAIRRQIGARARAASVSRDAGQRRSLSLERTALLERLFELDEDVAAVGAAIAIHLELGDFAAARALAGRAYALRPDDPSVRDAFVSSAPDLASLEDVLTAIRPELRDASRRELAAATLSARSAGVGFATVEQSHRGLAASAPRVVATPATDEIPNDALAEAAYLLLRGMGAGPTSTMTLRLEGPLRENAPVGQDLFAVRWPRGELLAWVTVPTREPMVTRLQWMSSLLRAQLPERGEVRLAAWSVDDAGAERSLSLRLSLEPGRARLTGSSLRLGARCWSAMARDVLRPARGLETTTFPAPTITLVLSPDLEARVRARLEGTRQPRRERLRCASEGGQLTCTGEGGPEEILELLSIVAVETVRAHLAPDG